MKLNTSIKLHVYTYNAQYSPSYVLDFLDTLKDQNHSEHFSSHLRPATTTYKYLKNGLLPLTLLRSPPSFSFNSAALTHSHYVILSSFHLPSSSRLTAGISSAGLSFHPTVFSLSSPSVPLHYLSAAGFHTSAMSSLPDKQKATIEKAVDIVKEKKKKVVDTLTKVHQLTCLLELLSDLLYWFCEASWLQNLYAVRTWMHTSRPTSY